MEFGTPRKNGNNQEASSLLEAGRLRSDEEADLRSAAMHAMKAELKAEIKKELRAEIEAGLKAKIRAEINKAGLAPAAKEAEDDNDKGEDAPEPPQEFSDASLWKSPLFIMTSSIGSGASMFLCLLLLINMFTQIGFIFILATTELSAPRIGQLQVDEFQTWRRTVAHEYSFYNSRTSRSLAARVCSRDGGLEVGTGQMNTYSALLAYLGPADAEDLSAVGPMMCVIALFVWILTNAQEVHASWCYTLAILALPIRDATVFSKDDDGNIVVEALGRWRLVSILFVTLVRLLICCLLLIFGCFFLVYTVSVAELLLNTVALEFVLNVDELIFSIAPARVLHVYSTASALRVPPSASWKGLDMRTGSLFLTVVAVLGTIVSTSLLPQTSTLVAARDALCAGDIDFVYTRDGMGAVAWAYPETVDQSIVASRNFPSGTWDYSMGAEALTTPKESYGASVVDTLLRQQGRAPFQEACNMSVCYYFDEVKKFSLERPDRPDCCFAKKVRVPNIDAGRFALKTKTNEDTATAVALWNPSCIEVLDAGMGYANLIHGAMADAANSVEGSVCGPSGKGCPATAPLCRDGECIIPSCANVARHCHENTVAGVRARQLCPITCGCDAPWAPLALSLPASGCGARCLDSGTYLDAKAALPCEDLAVDDPTWISLMDDMEMVSSTWPLDWRQGAAQWIKGLRRYGCPLLSSTETMATAFSLGNFPPYILSVNGCIEGGTFFPLKPLSYFCPAACGCRSGDMHCPDQCPERTPETPICTAVQRSQMANPLSDKCPVTDTRNFGARRPSDVL